MPRTPCNGSFRVEGLANRPSGDQFKNVFRRRPKPEPRPWPDRLTGTEQARHLPAAASFEQDRLFPLKAKEFGVLIKSSTRRLF